MTARHSPPRHTLPWQSRYLAGMLALALFSTWMWGVDSVAAASAGFFKLLDSAEFDVKVTRDPLFDGCAPPACT